MSKTIFRLAGFTHVLFLTSALLAFPKSSFATESGPQIAPSPSTAATPRDLQVLLRIRRTLVADETLAPMNVGIIVRDGVATLWGPLSSGEEIRHALETVREVRGVNAVRSELYVAKDARPARPVFVLPDTTYPDRPAPTDVLVSSGQRTWLMNRKQMLPNPLAEETPINPAPSSPTPPRTAALRSPVWGNAGPDEPTTVTVARAEGVPEAINRIQKSDARFGQINAEYREGTIVLSGVRHEAAAVMAFARLLSDVPGVERILVQNPRKPQ